MTHLFRPVDPPTTPSPPVGAPAARPRAVAARPALARLGGLFRWLQRQGVLQTALLALGLVLQVLLILTAAYVVDLALSLMELWAELARKHLELTL